MEWVAARHGDDTALRAAWGAGLRAGDSVSNPAMEIYGAWQMHADGPDWGLGPVLAERARLGDFIRFLAETQRGYYDRRRQEIAGLGFEGLFVTTAWRAGGPAAEAANAWTDDAGDAIDRHSYFGGGVGGHQVAVGTVNAETHLDQPGSGIVGGHLYGAAGERVVLFQVEDKPVIMSEWTQSPPNEWKAEIAPLQAFYGMGLNGWDASIHFATSLPRLGSGWPSDARAPSSYVSETPHYFGQLPALARALHLGHVREGELVAGRRLVLDELFAGFDPLSRDLPAGRGYPGEAGLRTPPEVAAIGRVTFAPDHADRSVKVDWDSYWDTAAEVIRSTTGELTWDYGDRVVRVETPWTQGLIGFAGGARHDLPAVQIDVVTAFVSLLFTPLDDRPLAESEHVLITALARDRQWNTTYSADRRQLLQVGGPPLLLEPVQATITFPGAAILSAVAVDVHGVPTATEVARTGNTITIDGTYQSYYYEVRRAPAARCIHRSDASGLAPLTPARDALFLASPDPGGVTLDAMAPLARVPYDCGIASGAPDPEPVLDPSANPLIFYQVGPDPGGPLRLVKDDVLRTVRFEY